MPDKDVTLNIRCSAEQRDLIDQQAAEQGLNRSEWVLRVLTEKLDRPYTQMSDRGTTVIMRSRTGYRSPQICDHPLHVRSAKSVDGSSKCFACLAVIEPYL